MPANLTPQYLEAEKRFKAAENLPEKIAALNEMMAIIPKHKGTEKIRAELKRKLSVLRKESTQKKSTARKNRFHLEREGARQLALVGAPNSGKSSMVVSLTHAKPEVADYPFTTRVPISGMLVYDEVRLQLVDLPPVSHDHLDSWVPQIIGNADAILWVVDLSDDGVLDCTESTLEVLREARIELAQHKTLMVGNKIDAPDADGREEILREIYGEEFSIIRFSSVEHTQHGTSEFGRQIYEFLDLVRVYTKTPGRKADRRDPFVLARGSTILDLAGAIHRSLATDLKFAKVWGGVKADGLMVGGEFVLDNGDIVELHAS